MIKSCKICRRVKTNQTWLDVCYSCKENIEKAQAKRRKYFNESPSVCVFCEREEDPEIHHIDKNRKNNVKTNLLRLCRRCHRTLHAKIYKRIWPNLNRNPR